MFPFRDHNPSSRVPYVTYALMGINILVFLSYAVFLNDLGMMSRIYGNFAAIPAEYSAGQDYFTLITSMFMHAGFMHLAGNMLFLWIFGDNIEDALGHIGFLIFYIASGLGAVLWHIYSDPSSQVPMVGASGAIAGVMGAYLLLYPKAKVDFLLILIIIFRTFTVPAFIVLGAWMAMQVFGEISSTGEGGVAYWAHIGGFIVGIVLILPKFIQLGGPRFWQRAAYHPPHKDSFETKPTKIPLVEARKSPIPVVRR